MTSQVRLVTLQVLLVNSKVRTVTIQYDFTVGDLAGDRAEVCRFC
jgi:hypothetical protein